MNANSIDQLRQLHPDASVEALELHAHIAEYAMKADIPTEMLIDWAHVVPKPPLVIVGPAGSARREHGHSDELRIYGLFQGECTRCVSSYPLWTPRPEDDLLRHPDAVKPALFDLGVLLDTLREHERRQPNDRFKDIIANHEETIDLLDDLITESDAYRNPPDEVEDGGRRGY